MMEKIVQVFNDISQGLSDITTMPEYTHKRRHISTPDEITRKSWELVGKSMYKAFDVVEGRYNVTRKA